MTTQSGSGAPAVPDLARLRGEADLAPALSVVIPVNAQGDLDRVWDVLGDLARYEGAHSFEVILVVNNYDPDHPPSVDAYERAGIRVVSMPSVWRRGEVVSFSARVPGIRAARSPQAVLFDADCRIPEPAALLDWYVSAFARSCDAAYTRVDFSELRPLWSVRVKVLVHHLARAVKRVVLHMPTTRGSNYAVRCSTFLRLYDEGLLADELNVGPTIRAAGGRVAYSGSKRLAVLTSGRRFQGGWSRLYRQLRYRLRYNLRMLPIRANSERHPYHDENLR